MKLQAVLFDLDNTLILFEELAFFEHYTKKLYLSFTDLLTPKEFTNKLIQATQMLVQNNGEKSNAEFFIDQFADGLPIAKNMIWSRFEQFYAHEFEQFRSLMKPVDQAKDVILSAKERGLKLVIASNPMFPMNVQLARLRWAGLENISFDLITSADNTTFVKPRLEYYNQICDKIQVKAEHCIMVGNDAFNDMIASKTGMTTYLTTDTNQISIELSRELAKNVHLELPTPNFKGPLQGLIHVIDQL